MKRLFLSFLYLTIFTASLSLAQDSSNVSRLGYCTVSNADWDDGGVVKFGVALNGNTAYINSFSSGANVIDITTPTNPTVTGSFSNSTLSFSLYSLANAVLVGDYGLQSYNVSNPSTPSFQSVCSNPNYGLDIAVQGNYAYVAQHSYFYVYTIANLNSISSVATITLPSHVASVEVVGNYAYAGTWSSGIQIINISTPSNPTQTGSFDATAYRINDIEIVGNRAYVCEESSGIRAYDITNPLSPSQLSFFATTGSPKKIKVVGNLAYIACFNNGLRILDVSNPSNITEVGHYNSGLNAVGLDVRNNSIYLRDQNRFSIFTYTPTSSLTLSRPNGSENLLIGSNDTIRWTNSGVTGNIRIDLNRNYPSGTWDSIATVAASSSSYLWTVTGPITTTARIRVISTTNSSIGDSSDANFTITQPFLTLQRPAGGENLYIGTSDTVRWTSSLSGNATISYNRSYPTGAWTTLTNNTPITQGYYGFSVTPPATSNARFAIVANSNPSLTDTSHSAVNIRARALQMVSPNGGETRFSGHPDTIRWNNFGTSPILVGISYAGSNIDSMQVIANNLTPGLTSLAWTPGSQTNTHCRMYLTDINGIEAWSSNDFTILNANINMTHPNGGEILRIGTIDTFRWSATGFSGNLQIQLNRNYPSSTWETLFSNISNSGSIPWTVSGTISANARMRITSVDYPAISDTSNTNFTIVQPTLLLSRPNGGETYRIGLTDTIQWSSTNLTGNILIQLNRNYPSGTWDTLFANTANSGSIPWTVISPISINARVRITSLNFPMFSDTSNSEFAIVQPTLALTRPNGGDTFRIGTNDTIRWTSSNLTGTIRIELNRNYPNGTWDTITTNAINSGSFGWLVTAPVSSNAGIRLTSNDFPIFTVTSNSYFNIIQPSLQITRPIGGETFYAGKLDSIKWTSSNLTGNMRIEINRNYPGGLWETIFSSTANTGIVAWTATGPSSSFARIRVTSIDFPAYTSSSNASFTILQPTFSLIHPNGGETLYLTHSSSQYEGDTIRWTSSNLPGLITIKTNYPNPVNGVWQTLADSIHITNNRWYWNPIEGDSGTIRNDVRVALISRFIPTLAETSATPLTIRSRSISFTHPIHNDTIYINQPDTIRLNNYGGGEFLLTLSNAGQNYDSLVILPNADTVALGSTSFVWTPTTQITNASLFIYDYRFFMEVWSDTFKILDPYPRLTNHNDGRTLWIGESDTIRWIDTNAVGNLRIDLNRNYPVGTWDSIGVANARIGQFVWTPTLPQVLGVNARYRLVWLLHPNYADTTDLSFKILQRSLVLQKPVRGESFYIGLYDTIRWSASNTFNGFKIEYSYSTPDTWRLVRDTVAYDSARIYQYIWNPIPTTPSTSVRVKVTALGYANPSYKDSTHTAFNIQSVPNFAVTPSSLLDFGSRQAKQTCSLMVHIANPIRFPFKFQTITGASISGYTKHIVNTDSLIQTNDTLRIWVQFRPDSVLTYRDTLRLTFGTPYNPISIPITGLGIGYYIYLSPSTLSFPLDIEPTRRDSLTLTVNVQGNQPLGSAYWIPIPSGQPFSALPILNLPLGNNSAKVYFQPITPGNYSAQLGLVSNAVNGDTIRISVSGSSHYLSPASPNNLAINRVNEDAQLTWSRVDTTVGGAPLVVQRYLIYFRNDSNVAWQFLNATSGANATNFTHTYVVSYSRAMYYRVTAWVGNTDSFDRVIRTIPVGTPEEEVKRVLGDGW